MIFGYNTDVRHRDVVYHVQSEARQNDLLLQTLIYVKGQCVGKQVFSYAAQALQPDFSESVIHELLKGQHKSIVDAIQQGRMESILAAQSEISDIGGGSLVLTWINSRDHIEADNLKMRLQVLEDGSPAAGAEIVLLASPPAQSKLLAQGYTDSSGHAEFRINVSALEEPAVMARASRQGKSGTRKFRFRK